MGADAHGAAALGHRQSHGQRLFPARQMNGMLPTRVQGRMFLQPVRRAAARVRGSAKTSLVVPARSTSPLSITIISLHRR